MWNTLLLFPLMAFSWLQSLASRVYTCTVNNTNPYCHVFFHILESEMILLIDPHKRSHTAHIMICGHL